MSWIITICVLALVASAHSFAADKDQHSASARALHPGGSTHTFVIGEPEAAPSRYHYRLLNPCNATRYCDAFDHDE
ncbi:MAG: hypothetical protein AAF351_09495 [Pseudomonadota bacterium]